MSSQEITTSGANPSDKKVAISTALLALAFGSGLAATPAEAKLITTPLDLTVAAGHSQNFGPVGDEFTITNFGLDGSILGIELQGNTTELSKNFVAIKAGGGSPPFLDFFGPGKAIDNSLTFGTQGVDSIAFDLADNFLFHYGLKTVDASDPLGFVTLDVLRDTDLHLDSFSFQDTPGQPAVVVPEPGTLSLFAVGGAALLAARRRKKKQKAA